jgi:hypothetical protein
MTNRMMNSVLVTAAAMLLTTGAWADPPKTAPGAEKAAAGTEKAADGKPKTAEVRADKPEGKALGVKAEETKAEKPADHAARAKAQHDALRAKLHGPLTEAMKQELRRHAQRVARIERIKAVAVEQKDKDTADRADKLLDKENTRHDKWLAQANSTTPSPEKAKTEAKVDLKGGAR